MLFIILFSSSRPVEHSQIYFDKNFLFVRESIGNAVLYVKKILATKCGVNSVYYRLKESMSMKNPKYSLSERNKQKFDFRTSRIVDYIYKQNQGY